MKPRTVAITVRQCQSQPSLFIVSAAVEVRGAVWRVEFQIVKSRLQLAAACGRAVREIQKKILLPARQQPRSWVVTKPGQTTEAGE